MKFRSALAPLMATFGLMFLVPAPAHADAQDFTIPIFEADYYLSRDSQHISHLQVNEHIVAEFPEIDQNHGILRALPKTYEGHSVSLQLQRVVDGAGRAWNYTTSTQNDNLVLKIGDAGTYVHGRQTYDISYSMANVTANPAGHNGHFWDVNGDQWSQPFGRVTARVHLTPELTAALQPQYTRCFTGVRGSTSSDCAITNEKPSNDSYTSFITTRPLTAGETLTYELGFASGTFVAYTRPAGELNQLIAKIIFLGLLPPLLAFVFIVRRWRRFGRDPEGRGTIVAEYAPPKELSVISSSVLLHEGFQAKAISAQILDLAVRGYLKIYEVTVKKLLKDKTSYEIELIRAPDGLRTEETAALVLLLGANPSIGARVNLDTLANKLYSGATSLGSAVQTQLTTDGYFQTNPSKAKLPYLIGGIALIFVSVLGFPYTLGLIASGIILLIGSQFMPARTAQGVTLREYLLGLKLYMQMAEADRIKMLQSPHGELTEKIDVSDTAKLVKLYEKLLPYAMLFGIEKDWAKEFANLYKEAPDWYSGSSNFSAGYFAASLAGFSNASTASFTAPSSSGSGGSSGGGGGGGGGGGW